MSSGLYGREEAAMSSLYVTFTRPPATITTQQHPQSHCLGGCVMGDRGNPLPLFNSLYAVVAIIHSI